jgi:hypothetical protein
MKLTTLYQYTYVFVRTFLNFAQSLAGHLYLSCWFGLNRTCRYMLKDDDSCLQSFAIKEYILSSS